MDKIRNLAELRKMKSNMVDKLQLRENSDSSEAIIQIKVGMATSGIASCASGNLTDTTTQ